MKRLRLLAIVLALACAMSLVSCEYLLDEDILNDFLFGDDFYEDDLDDDDDYLQDDGEDESSDDVDEHICSFGKWTVTEEATCKAEGEKERECSVCGELEFEIIPALEHTVVIDAAVEPTESTPGKTEGKHCSVCGFVIVRQEYIYSGDYSNIEKYSGSYAYEYLLANYQKGEAMQAFYKVIDEEVTRFHLSSDDAKSKTVSNTTVYYAAEISFSELGLNSDEAVTVWSAYRHDNPLYYWMSNRISYLSDKITLVVYDDYIDGDTRAEYNARLYDKVGEYIGRLGGKGGEYQTALSFHDGIILSADYAYEDDGVTPEDAAYAHNVLGVMLLGEGVCESYTKAFQLLLNYCGIENIYVSGYAGEPHAWNLVEMSDGEWYWFDLTWDDTPKIGLGVRYSYFCVNDTDNVKVYDGAPEAFATFLQDHTPSSPNQYGTDFVYNIPSRSTKSYSHDGAMVRDDVIVIDGLSYVISGSETCALIDIAADGDVVIPEKITHQGLEYTVAIIGKFENGKIGSGSVIVASGSTYTTPEIESITIPKTVKVIWDYAFINAKTVKSFIVDSGNTVYASQDGVLFTKNLYTLIQYPFASSMTSYSVPDVTVEIAYGAFGDGGNVFYAKKLSRLYIGSNVTVIGAAHFGKGYRDSTPINNSEIVVIDGYLEKLQNVYGSKLKKS